MEPKLIRRLTLTTLVCALSAFAQRPNISPEKEAAIKADLAGQIDGMKKQAQVMVDSVFSFGELGFQEFETSKYLAPRSSRRKASKSGANFAGYPHRIGSPPGVRASPSSLSDLTSTISRKLRRNPASAYHDPMIEGAPGHGEGHNSGVPSEHHRGARRQESDGTRASDGHHPALARSRRGVGRRQSILRASRAASKMWTSASSLMSRAISASSYGPAAEQNGLVSVEYMFKGESAHAAAAPWRGKSALDAVELMDVGWNSAASICASPQRSIT